MRGGGNVFTAPSLAAGALGKYFEASNIPSHDMDYNC